MDVLQREDVGLHIMGMVFCLRGPSKAPAKVVMATRGCMGAFVVRGKWSTQKGPKPFHFPYTKFLEFAAEYISPLPSSWVAVVGDRACAFRETGAWHRAITLAVTYELDNLAQGSDWEPAVIFIPGTNVQSEGVEFGVSELPESLRTYAASCSGDNGVDGAADDSIRTLLSLRARLFPKIPETIQDKPKINQVTPHNSPVRPFGLKISTTNTRQEFFDIQISPTKTNDQSVCIDFGDIIEERYGDPDLSKLAAKLMGTPCPTEDP